MSPLVAMVPVFVILVDLIIFGVSSIVQILHLCYELTALWHAQSVDKTSSIKQVRFWTEQLKNFHMIRYGHMGNDLETVRKVLQHTKGVLRRPNGYAMAQFNFI